MGSCPRAQPPGPKSRAPGPGLTHQVREDALRVVDHLVRSLPEDLLLDLLDVVFVLLIQVVAEVWKYPDPESVLNQGSNRSYS